ncbi:MAG: signal peptidase II [Alphaproteobacteria bacterium]|nr:signal peptidase II [Alphaproteobacteria bacterium]MBV9932360.1 signal peptidase II [Alphaproteobacteria bacterium]
MAEAGLTRKTGRARDEVRRNRAVGLAIAILVLAADQLSKWAVLNPLRLVERSLGGEGIVLLPFFRFIYVENPGISMRFLPADGHVARWLLVALTGAIAAFVLAWMWREKRRDDAIALALILGGALGNILDRVRLGFVVDFADLHVGDLHPFLVFNLGDAAITVGVLVLLARALLRDGRKPRGPAEATNG